jgi:hypothetical protein
MIRDNILGCEYINGLAKTLETEAHLPKKKCLLKEQRLKKKQSLL